MRGADDSTVPTPRWYIYNYLATFELDFSTTSYTVQPSSAEDRELFREQEQMRFEQPHKAFTYMQHGYESIVGPVKGYYQKVPPHLYNIN